MVHMPSHIYMRVGRYQESYDANAAASQADAEYIVQCRAQGIYPLNYYPHNMHFKVWSAMFLGQSQQALADAGYDGYVGHEWIATGDGRAQLAEAVDICRAYSRKSRW